MPSITRNGEQNKKTFKKSFLNVTSFLNDHKRNNKGIKITARPVKGRKNIIQVKNNPERIKLIFLPSELKYAVRK